MQLFWEKVLLSHKETGLYSTITPAQHRTTLDTTRVTPAKLLSYSWRGKRPYIHSTHFLLPNEVCLSKTSSEITQATVRKMVPLEQKHDCGFSTPASSTLAAEVLLCCGNYSQAGLTDRIRPLTALGDKKKSQRNFFYIWAVKCMHVFHTAALGRWLHRHVAALL